jgi:quercetin dioxygenase-like cupin family protein
MGTGGGSGATPREPAAAARRPSRRALVASPAVRSWNLTEIEVKGGSRSPVVLDSDEAARAVLIVLEPGQELGDHQVKEHAFLLVVDGAAEVESQGETVDARAGTLFMFDPDERRAVSTRSGARILLLLAPWPGVGHYRGAERA